MSPASCAATCVHWRQFFTGLFQLVAIDAHAREMHVRRVSKPKKAKPSEDAATPGTVMAAKIRARANKLTESEREALMGDAMRIIYGSEGDAAPARIAVPVVSAEFSAEAQPLAFGIRRSVC